MKRFKNNKSGMALVLVLVSSLMLMIMAVIALLFVEKHSRFSIKTTSRTKGYYLAEAAVFRAMYELQQGVIVYDGLSPASGISNPYLATTETTIDGIDYPVSLTVTDDNSDGVWEVSATVEYIGANRF